MSHVKEEDMPKFAVTHIISKKIGNDKKVVLYNYLKDACIHTCVELCPEYIEYLKNVLKQFLK